MYTASPWQPDDGLANENNVRRWQADRARNPNAANNRLRSISYDRPGLNLQSPTKKDAPIIQGFLHPWSSGELSSHSRPAALRRLLQLSQSQIEHIIVRPSVLP